MAVKYFHELTDQEWEELKRSGKTWGDIMHEFLAPDWCEERQAALAGPAGCSGLALRAVRDESYCIGCDFHKGVTNMEWWTDDDVYDALEYAKLAGRQLAMADCAKELLEVGKKLFVEGELDKALLIKELADNFNSQAIKLQNEMRNTKLKWLSDKGLEALVNSTSDTE